MTEQQPMTAEQMAEIVQALDAATPGPWQAYRDGEVDFFGGEDGAYCFPADDFEPADAYLIANAPTWLRSLSAEVQRLQTEYADERASHNAHVAELLAAEAEVQRQQGEVERLTAEIERLTTERVEMREEYVRFRSNLRAERDRLQAENDQLRESVQNWADAAAGWESQAEQIRQRLEDAVEALRRIETESMDSSLTASNALEEIERLKGDRTDG